MKGLKKLDIRLLFLATPFSGAIGLAMVAMGGVSNRPTRRTRAVNKSGLARKVRHRHCLRRVNSEEEID